MDILNYLHSISITVTLDNVIVGIGLIVFFDCTSLYDL